MKLKPLSLLFCAVLLGSSIPPAAAQEYTFGTFPIPLMVVDKDKGVFIELTKTIAQRAGLHIRILVQPPKRSLSNFRQGKIDALFPAVDVYFASGIKIEKSKELIYIKEDFVFTRKGTELFRIIPDLEGKKVGITMGYPYVPELKQNNLIRLETANGDELNVKKLINKRIDAFVVEEKSGVKAFENVNLKHQMQYDPETPLSRQDVYYAFQPTEKGKKLADLVSKILKEMKDDGTFGRIMDAAKPQ